MVFSSSFKGALKQSCAETFNAVSGETGRVDCSKARECCCLFGGEGDASEGASLVGLSDLYPLAVPVPSLDRGYVYLTSKYLIDTLADLFRAVGYGEGVRWLESLGSGVEGR